MSQVKTISVPVDEPQQPVSNSKQQSLKKQGTSRYVIQSVEKFSQNKVTKISNLFD